MSWISEKKLAKAWKEIMIELYKNSTPSADFEKLLEEASLNERGEKVIDFNSYEIEEDKMKEIVESVIKKYKITNNRQQSKIYFNVYLGASPKTKLINHATNI